jgi:murein L,D-transpeptidase YcbB/YkuD
MQRASWLVLCVLALAGGCSRDDAGSAVESGREAIRALRGEIGGAPDEVGRSIRAVVTTGRRPAYVAPGAPGDLLWKVLQRFYHRRNFQPAWVSDDRGRNQARSLVRALGAANAAGTDSLKAGLDRLSGSGSHSPRESADLDLHLSYAYLSYRAQAIQDGVRSSAVSITGESDSLLQVGLREASVGAALPRVAASVGEGNERSPHGGSEELRQALAEYERIATLGGWPALPAGIRLQLGSSGPTVSVLKRRLAVTGDLRPSFLQRVFRRGGRDVFDAETEAALRRFQERHGLKADGILGPETVVALDVPAAVRVRHLRANLARAQDLSLATGRVIVVNAPDYRLRAYEDGRQALDMRVVIGTEYNPTPTFSDRMTYLVFRPYWNIPTSIAVEEIVPEIQRDSAALKRKDLEVVVAGGGDSARVVDPKTVDWSGFESSGYMLRRRPGPGNPLGDVKFMFPNQYNVYLHDTPQDNQFRQQDRTFSHGCVRVEKPLELAEFVLRGKPGWDREHIRTAMTSGETQNVGLPEPIPVHIVYWTAWVDESGRVQFRDDIYGLDEPASAGSRPIPPPSPRGGIAAKPSGR